MQATYTDDISQALKLRPSDDVQDAGLRREREDIPSDGDKMSSMMQSKPRYVPGTSFVRVGCTFKQGDKGKVTGYCLRGCGQHCNANPMQRNCPNFERWKIRDGKEVTLVPMKIEYTEKIEDE